MKFAKKFFLYFVIFSQGVLFIPFLSKLTNYNPLLLNERIPLWGFIGYFFLSIIFFSFYIKTESKVKIHKSEKKEFNIFFVSTVFYSIISGALIGAAVNLITDLISKPRENTKIILVIITMVSAISVLLVYLSLFIDKGRRKSKDENYYLTYVKNNIERIYFASTIIFGVLLLIIMIIIIFLN